MVRADHPNAHVRADGIGHGEEPPSLPCSAARKSRAFTVHSPRRLVGHTAPMAVEKILQEALALPVKERSELAAALLRSIEPEDDEVLTEAEWEAAWAAELARRAKDIDEGRAQLIPAEEVFAELRARFPPR